MDDTEGLIMGQDRLEIALREIVAGAPLMSGVQDRVVRWALLDVRVRVLVLDAGRAHSRGDLEGWGRMLWAAVDHSRDLDRAVSA